MDAISLQGVWLTDAGVSAPIVPPLTPAEIQVEISLLSPLQRQGIVIAPVRPDSQAVYGWELRLIPPGNDAAVVFLTRTIPLAPPFLHWTANDLDNAIARMPPAYLTLPTLIRDVDGYRPIMRVTCVPLAVPPDPTVGCPFVTLTTIRTAAAPAGFSGQEEL